VRTIRASEIGTYLYCRRAWWYQRKEVPSENIHEMVIGTEIHRQHGRTVIVAGCLRTLAMGMLLAAMVLLVIHFVGKVL
jgi:CRISPR/Cas system-associated exonuclease Cas4 (RecB family)